MQSRPSLALSLAALFVAAGGWPASAQQPASAGDVSLAIHAGYHEIGGDDFTGTDAGLALDGVGRYTLPGGIALGAGVGFSSHGLDGASENLDFLSLFGEASYAFEVDHPRVRPLVGGRLGYRRWSTDAVEGGVSVGFDADGIAATALGGAEIGVGPRFAVEVTGQVGYMSFGDVEIADVPAEGSGRSGILYGLDVGLQILLGG